MGNMLLTIQHDGQVFSPPVENGIKIEWERTGAPGKLTFTTIQPSSGSMEFTEGDPVCFYYDNKPIFMGYVFTKKHDKEQKTQVTCYDQIRYLKNKFTYVFEKKTATQIVKALCEDFNLYTGEMDNTNYIIPAIAEENKAALDIVLNVLEETLTNTGDMFVLYDDFGKLKVKNVENMISRTLLYEDTAENFNYSSSIDEETYNQIVLYYKKDNEIVQLYTAQSPSSIKQWGTLRYFEEVKSPTIGQNKANSLLQLYNRKTRELKVIGAFGDITVRGGTLIPVKLNLGDVSTENYMLVDKVTHHFEDDLHTMDLTLEGAWGDKTTDMQSNTIGNLPSTSTSTSTGSTGDSASNNGKYDYVLVWMANYAKNTMPPVYLTYYKDGKKVFHQVATNRNELYVDKNTNVSVSVEEEHGYRVDATCTGANWTASKGTSNITNRFRFYADSGSRRVLQLNWKGQTTTFLNKLTLNLSGFTGSISIKYVNAGQQKMLTRTYDSPEDFTAPIVLNCDCNSITTIVAKAYKGTGVKLIRDVSAGSNCTVMHTDVGRECIISCTMYNHTPIKISCY